MSILYQFFYNSIFTILFIDIIQLQDPIASIRSTDISQIFF